MTPMIDVVFQMIIFFICTIDLDKEKFDKNVTLEWARTAEAVEDQDPLTITVNVRQDGVITIGGTRLNPGAFRAILRNAVARYGTRVPVVIRGDRDVLHGRVRELMDACKSVGIWKVSFAAIVSEG